MSAPPSRELSADECRQYAQSGVLGPYPLLDEAEIEAVLQDFGDTYTRVPWYKSLHSYDTACFRVAARDEIVDRVASLLGDDLILWATQVMTKPPGESHRWHVDVETLAWRAVNVWTALRNVTVDSTIHVVPGSHHYGQSIQAVAEQRGLDLDDPSDVVRAARKFDPDAQIERIDVGPGAFVIFDGLLWHGSENTTPQPRSALLTQYSPSTEWVRMPATFSPPVRWKAEPPPCVLLRGTDRSEGRNDLIQPAPPPRPRRTRRFVDRVRRRR